MAISLSNLATSACQYKNQYYDYDKNQLYQRYDFTCDERIRDTGSKFCIFHDINYLKDDNYEKHKEEVAKRFREKVSEYSSNNMPLKFIGYCLLEISFENEKFSEMLYFNEAIFYGAANFHVAKFWGEHTYGSIFFNEAYFDKTAFSKEADFSGATFSNLARFSEATFSKEADFHGATFSSRVYFSGEFNGQTYFNYTIFEEPSKVTFDISNMSNVSFSDSDITRIRWDAFSHCLFHLYNIIIW